MTRFQKTDDPTAKKNLTLDEESILALQEVQQRLAGEFGFVPTQKQTVLYLINLYRQQPRR